MMKMTGFRVLQQSLRCNLCNNSRNTSIYLFVGRIISIFVLSNSKNLTVKSSELNKLILTNGWSVVRQAGSHVMYEKNGIRYVVPFHGSKEVGKGLECKIRKEM
jgi:mRNA interferase HicA